MFHKVKAVTALSDWKLCVQFAEGVTKIYDIAPLFQKWAPFRAFLDMPERFAGVEVDAGGYGIVWDDDLDLSCNELYENGRTIKTPFDGLIAFTEATQLWGLNESTLRKAISYGKIVNGVDACKFGKQWVVSKEAMNREYGIPKEDREENREVVMCDDTRYVLNRLYRPLDEKRRAILADLNDLHFANRIESGYYNGHYHKDTEGTCHGDAYPIPVISVMGLCDIEIDFDGISVTAKLSRQRAVSFDWTLFSNLRFEVYGVEDWMRDYGNEQTVSELKNSVLSGEEKELFVTFLLPPMTDSEEIERLLQKLQTEQFYY